MLRSGPFGCREVPRMREARPHDLAPRRLVTVNTKAHRDGRTHLDGRAAAFRIALRKVSIAHRVERAFDIDGYEEPGTDRHLLDVGIAAILPWRNGAQTVLCNCPRRRHGAFALRQEHHSAARPQLAFALGPSCELLMRGRKACRTHEGAVGNADTWNRRRCRPLLRQIPMYQVG